MILSKEEEKKKITRRLKRNHFEHFPDITILFLIIRIKNVTKHFTIKPYGRLIVTFPIRLIRVLLFFFFPEWITRVNKLYVLKYLC